MKVRVRYVLDRYVLDAKGKVAVDRREDEMKYLIHRSPVAGNQNFFESAQNSLPPHDKSRPPATFPGIGALF